MSQKKNTYGLNQSSNPFSIGTPTTEEEKEDYVSSSLRNAQTRIGLSGFDTEAIADQRNAVQKTLGMSKDTGIISGFFDLMNRPSKAIAGAFQELTNASPENVDTSNMTLAEIQAHRDKIARNGDSSWSKIKHGFTEGLTGQTDYSWSNVLLNLEGGRESEGLKDWTTWTGLAMDMLLDPMSLAIVPVKAAQAVKGVDALGDVAKAAEGLEALSKVEEAGNLVRKGAKALNKAEDLTQTAAKLAGAVPEMADAIKATETIAQGIETAERYKTIKGMLKGVGKSLTTVGEITDANRYLFSSDWINTHNSLNQTIYGGIFKGVKGVGRGAKNIISSGFDRYNDVNPANAKALKTAYDDLMNTTKKFFTRSDKDIVRANRLAKGTLSDLNDANAIVAGTTIENLNEMIETGALDVFKDANEASKKLTMMYEFFEQEPHTTSAGEFVDSILRKRGVNRVHLGTDEFVDSLKSIFPGDLENFGISFSTNAQGKRMVNFANDFWDGLDNAQIDQLIQSSTTKDYVNKLAKGEKLYSDWTEKTIRFGTSYSAEDIAEFNELMANEGARKAYNNFSEGMRKIQTNIGTYLYDDPTAVVSRSQKGYVPHTLNPEIRQSIDGILAQYSDELNFSDTLFSPEDIDTTNFITPTGSTSALKGRKLQGNMTDVNIRMREYYSNLFKDERWVEKAFGDAPEALVNDMRDLLENTDWFIQDARVNMYDLVSGKTKAMSNAKLKTDILLRTTFDGALDGRSGLVKVDAANKKPAGAEILSNLEVANLRNSLKNTAYYGGETEQVKHLTKMLTDALDNNGQVALDKHLKRFVGSITKNDGEKLLDTLDNIMGVVRSNKLLSPGYNMRNVGGNTINMWLSGMTMDDIFTNLADADDIIKWVSDADNLTKVPPQELAEGVELYRQMLREGALGTTFSQLMNVEDFKTVLEEGRDLSEIVNPVTWQQKQGLLQKAKEVNMGLNQAFDDRSRLAIALNATKNPDYIRNLGVVKNAIDASRFVMFDPSDLSLFEDQYVKRATMFYTFFRQNIVYHAKNLLNNTDRYYKMYKTFNKLQESSGLSEDQRSDWDSMFDISAPFGTREDGSYQVLRTNNPFQEFMNFTSDPLGTAVGMTLPILKAPFEIAQDAQIWDGKPVSDNYVRYLFGLTGLDVPAGSFEEASKIVNDMFTKGASYGAEASGRFLGILKSRNKSSNERASDYQKLQQLQKFIEEQKKQGSPIPTIAELKEQGLSTDNKAPKIK